MKGLSLETKSILESAVAKIKQGRELTLEKYHKGIAAAVAHFTRLGINKIEDAEYNHKFITGQGEVGVLSNKMLKNACKVEFGDESAKKCNYSKILLSYNDANLRLNKSDGLLTDNEASSVRLASMREAGLTPKADLASLVCTISGKDKCNIGSVNELVDIVKPNVKFVEGNNGLFASTAARNKSSNISTTFALSSLRGVLTETFGIAEASANHKVIANSLQEVADTFGVSVSSVVNKFGGSGLSGLEAHQGKSVFSNIFEVKANPTVTPLSISDIVLANISPMRDPEFMVKFVTAPVAVNAKAAEIIIGQVHNNITPIPIPSNVLNGRALNSRL